jgi:hypothetical protein
MSTDRAEHAGLKVSERHIIVPAIGIELGLVVAPIIAAEDQDMAPTEATHGPQRDRFWWQTEIRSRPVHVRTLGPAALLDNRPPLVDWQRLAARW